MQTTSDPSDRWLRFPHRKPLTREEECELFRNIRNGETMEIRLAAREELIETNLPLVMKIARRFRASGLPLADLFQFGVFGLFKAIRKFRLENGTRFITYAYHWIFSCIQRGTQATALEIRLPASARTARSDAKLAREQLMKCGMDATPETIAAALDKTVPYIRDVLRTMNVEPVSMHLPISNDDVPTIGEAIPDEDSPSPEDAVETAERAAIVRAAVGRLDPDEQLVIKLRYLGHDPLTLQQAGTPLGKLKNRAPLSREGARQIELQALQKLKALLPADIAL